jgi:TonB-dependent starch-binding outer membrane protein SusC
MFMIMKNSWIYGDIPLIKNVVRHILLMKFLLLFTLVTGISLTVFADEPEMQQLTVTGTITDSQTGGAMPGVNIVVKGSTVGTISDANGKYSISVPDKNASLVFSFIGYVVKEMPTEGKSVVDIALNADIQNLEEVVVVGYGTQKRVSLTGSVATVSTKELTKTPTTNITNALAGILPGVVTKNTSGEPGRDNNVLLIRGRSTTGNTDPLVVVDGIQGVTGWERINSNDIESIAVLKDASAAIYGARAANGVILITTKRGKIGKPTINYTFNKGISQPTRLPKMADSYEFAQYVNQLDVEAGNTPRYSDSDLLKFQEGTDPNYLNVDWYKECLKRNTYMEQQNLNLRGGSEAVKYSISASYSNEDGIFKKTSLNYKTYVLRSNIDAQITKSLSIGVDLNGMFLNGNYPSGAYIGRNPFGTLKQIPFIPVYWTNGLPSAGLEDGENPIIMCQDITGNTGNKENRYVVKTSFLLNIPWVKGLAFDGYFAWQNNMTTTKTWQVPWEVYDYNKTTDTYTMKLGGRIVAPQLTEAYSGSVNALVNLRVKYELKLDKHTLNAFIAGEESNGMSRNFSAFRKSYLSSAIDEIFAGSLVDQSTTGTRSESGRANVFGRVSYGYMDKYLVDVNVRYDGSYAFPKGNQWGLFPGVQIAWRASQENFIKNLSFIDNLKVRASIGKIGNDAISAFQYLRLYTLGNTGMIFGQTQLATQGLVAGVSPNPNITWEAKTSSNIGLDASFVKGIIGFELDIFRDKRSNILATRDLAVPSYTGLRLPSENIGIVTNQGFEFQVFHSKTFSDFTYRVAANVAYAHSNIVDIDEAQNVPEYQKAEGHVIGAQRFYKALGIIRDSATYKSVIKYAGTKIGDLYYEDVDGNGKIDSYDMVMTDKTNIPEITYGFNLTANYKNFSLWANFAGAARYWQYYHVNARIAINQLEDVIVNRYTPGSMDSKYPRLPTLETQVEVSGLNSTFWMMDASYFKLKTLELSYNFPEKLLSKVKISGLRLYANGNNIFTIDKLKWNDPENSSNTNANYPQQKIFNLGLNITF